MNNCASPVPLQIDIVSDIVCPWCVIGYLQLQRALRQMENAPPVAVHWRPFELNPGMASGGQDMGEHLAQKYGSTPEQSRGIRQRLSDLGESLGFHFDYYPGMRIYNTFMAHQLLHWAAMEGLQSELKMALFEAYFSHRENVGDPAVLVATAEGVGLDPLRATEVIATACYASAVRAEQTIWLERDVHAVPTFFFNGGFPVPGAQEAATFVKVLERVRKLPAPESVRAP
jgi:predicted DsbA family dithiol-disulfide isomerase